MIAILEARQAGLFEKGKWLPNVISGLIVGIVALPLAMAFAIASGAKPEQGIYTAIIAGILVSVFGGSRVQIAGPTGAFIAILSGVTAKYGIAGLQLATLMAGVMLTAMGLARMGAVIKFIPAPVIIGFTTGIGVIIFVGQWKDFLGLPAVGGEHFHEKLLQLISVLPQLHGPTTGLALLGLGLVLYGARIPGLRRVPGPLTAMVVVSALQAVFHFEGVATIGTAFGGIPQGLPSLSLPEFSLSQVVQLLGPAFTIAMLGAIESLLSATVADGMAGTRHDSNQELVGQGLANIFAPLLGGFAATGAIARTATNIRNGGTSPLAGITHALTLVAVLLFLAPLASNIPLASLSAILFVVAYNMSELKRFSHILRRAPRADVVILLVTFMLTVFADLVVAVSIGVILAFMQFLRRMAESVDILPLQANDLRQELEAIGLDALPREVLVYQIDGPFFFGAVEKFESSLQQTQSDPKVLILRLGRVPFIDSTGLQVMDEVVQALQKRGIRVMFCEANDRVNSKLEKYGILERLNQVDVTGKLHEHLVSAIQSAVSVS
jgi:SulP family sulfate permease